MGVSGGKDSTCLALAMRERHPEIDMEYICTLTGNELPEVREHMARLEVLLGKPVRHLGIGKTLYQLIEEMSMVPNFRARWCTRILKIEPTIEFMSSLPVGSKLYVGLRADEPTREGIYGDEVSSVFPLKEWGWGIAEVKWFLADRGICVPKRTDCAACYHQRIGEWRDRPEEYYEAAAVEFQQGHTFRSPGRDTWPVALIDLAKDFESGRPVRSDKKPDDAERCVVCSM
jgi:3'-phosphoadenosine 5'-phosphosulfate sulfotransferase (PAPS reductase)/FAD synthetase